MTTAPFGLSSQSQRSCHLGRVTTGDMNQEIERVKYDLLAGVQVK